MRVDYHVHTSFSYDCQTSPDDVLERAAQAGLRCLCVTDHDTIDGALALRRIRPPGLEIVVGCEFRTSDGSHLIGLGLTEMIYEKRLLVLAQRIKEQGGAVVLPHPFRRGSGIFRNEMRRSEEFIQEVLSVTDLIECFNGGDTYNNNSRNFAFATEKRVPSIAGSDAHTQAAIGSGFVEYQAENVVHGVSARRVYFPAQRAVPESRLWTAVMEFYHRYKSGMPAPFRAGYRIAHERLTMNRRRRAVTAPILQFELDAEVPPGPSGEG